jgi:hypothetical protein
VCFDSKSEELGIEGEKQGLKRNSLFENKNLKIFCFLLCSQKS